MEHDLDKGEEEKVAMRAWNEGEVDEKNRQPHQHFSELNDAKSSDGLDELDEPIPPDRNKCGDPGKLGERVPPDRNKCGGSDESEYYRKECEVNDNTICKDPVNGEKTNGLDAEGFVSDSMKIVNVATGTNTTPSGALDGKPHDEGEV